jgi:hypothetical protein
VGDDGTSSPVNPAEFYENDGDQDRMDVIQEEYFSGPESPRSAPVVDEDPIDFNE